MIELFFIIPALLIYMLDYGFGKPGSDEPNVKSFLFCWPYFLAKKALQKAGVWDNLNRQYHDQISQASNGLQIAEINKSFKQMVFNQGRELFTWQNIVGMCPICTHFWINIFFMVLVNIFFHLDNIIIFTVQFLVGHLLIRILTKYF